MAAKLIPSTVTSEAADGEVMSTTEDDAPVRDESSTSFYVGETDSGEVASKVITNNKQVFFIQNFNGTFNC